MVNRYAHIKTKWKIGFKDIQNMDFEELKANSNVERYCEYFYSGGNTNKITIENIYDEEIKKRGVNDND